MILNRGQGKNFNAGVYEWINLYLSGGGGYEVWSLAITKYILLLGLIHTSGIVFYIPNLIVSKNI